MAKSKSFFTECNGRLFVRVDAVMHPLVPFVDGLELHWWPGEKGTYLDIDVAIAWCEKEAKEAPAEAKKYGVMVEVMQKAKRQVAAGNFGPTEDR